MRKHQVVPKLNKRGENLKMFSNFAIELGFWQYFGIFVAMEGLRRQGMSFSTCVKEQQSQTCYLAYKFCFKYFVVVVVVVVVVWYFFPFTFDIFSFFLFFLVRFYMDLFIFGWLKLNLISLLNQLRLT